MESFTTVGMTYDQIRDVYNKVLLDLYMLYNKCIAEYPFTVEGKIHILKMKKEIKELERTKKALKEILGD